MGHSSRCVGGGARRLSLENLAQLFSSSSQSLNQRCLQVDWRDFFPPKGSITLTYITSEGVITKLSQQVCILFLCPSQKSPSQAARSPALFPYPVYFNRLFMVSLQRMNRNSILSAPWPSLEQTHHTTQAEPACF